MYEIDKELLRDAIRTFGTESQIQMIEEECLELALAIQRLKRDARDMDQLQFNLIDELADVTIMIQQAHLMFNEELLAERIDYKVNRLKENLIDFKKTA